MDDATLVIGDLIEQLDRDARASTRHFEDVAVVIGRELVRKVRLLADAHDLIYRPMVVRRHIDAPLLTGPSYLHRFAGEELEQARAIAFTHALLRGLGPHEATARDLAFRKA